MSFDKRTQTWFLEGVTSYIFAEVDYFGNTKCLYTRPGFFSKVYPNKYYIQQIMYSQGN